MSKQAAENFIEALHDLEINRNVEKIASLFAPDAEIDNVVTVDSPHDLTAEEFWTKYRDNFGDVRSEFINKIYDEDHAALEWRTVGTNFHGSPVEYEGVSIVEFEGDQIVRFFAFFDPGKLGRQMEEQTAVA